jgi:hypothetical protein
MWALAGLVPCADFGMRQTLGMERKGARKKKKELLGY